VFAPQWSRLLTQTSSHANLVRIVGVTLYAEGVAIVPLTMIRMQARSRLFVTITISRFVVTLGLSFLMVVVLHWGVRGALLANAASAIAVVIVLSGDLRLALRSRPSWSLQRQMWSFGLPFFPVILSAWFIEASDRYLLGIYKGHAEVGYYVLGYKVAQIMQIALAAFSMGWAPLRYKIHERADAPQVYRQITSYYVLAAALLTVGIGVFAREIVGVIAPASYGSAASIVPLIAAGYALNGLYLMMVTGMGIAKKTLPMAWVVTAAAVANVGINVVAIPIWGMRAAAVTTVLANMIMVAGGYYYSQKVYPIPYEWRRIGLVVAIGTVVVTAVAFLTPGSGAIGIGTGAIAWVAFVVLLVKSTAITRSEVIAMRAGVRGVTRRAAAH
jgi:O-antigen/teichoic acid export membrane protein